MPSSSTSGSAPGVDHGPGERRGPHVTSWRCLRQRTTRAAPIRTTNRVTAAYRPFRATRRGRRRHPLYPRIAAAAATDAAVLLCRSRGVPPCRRCSQSPAASEGRPRPHRSDCVARLPVRRRVPEPRSGRPGLALDPTFVQVGLDHPCTGDQVPVSRDRAGDPVDVRRLQDGHLTQREPVEPTEFERC